MRILVVSAHFPPNFVSGGTLQPLRLARGLRARGHDVSVYAGWLESARKPLETWTDTDATGLPVRWVVTTPWTEWDDDRNFDNPAVTADFAAHLADVRPDAVHFHSLQSLGSGLLPVASRAGAAVVVTMHDFWWVCGRQFLVDPQIRPCSLVVDAGTCQCEIGREWLDDRNTRLARRLSHADLILAPSTVAAEVLAANGVDPARLEVDENGLPDTDVPRRRTGDAGPRSDQDVLRLLYTGGSNPLKGVHVLLAAARLLEGRPGWALTAHEAEGYASAHRIDLEGLPVTLRAAFDPADADAVYDAADVLLVPSVMRETYSLVTREALLRGLPVVCTDTLGPEEVVEHGRNGLIVPAADPGALAGAIRRLVDEPGLLADLRRGCQNAPLVRPIAAQVEGVEQALRRAVDHRRAVPADAGPAGSVRRVLFICGIDGAPLRYRARLPAEALALVGVASDVRHYRHPDVPGLAASADAIVVYRVPATTQVLALIAEARGRGIPTLFDVDDLIFDPDLAAEIPALQILPAGEAALWLEGVRRYRTTMETCDSYVGSTEELCRHARAVTGMEARRFGNGVGLLVGRLSDAALADDRRPGPLRIGYLSGTNTHDHDWAMVEPAVVDVLDRHPDVELWLVGLVTASPALDRFGARVVRQPPVPWVELPALLRQLDVNLAPLVLDSRFNQAKSAIKWLEAALTRTPTVASPTEPFAAEIEHGRNGFLATTSDDWVAALDRLLGDDDLRRRIGARACRDALLRWSPHLQGQRYRDILESARAAPAGGRRTTAWVPVAHDEPVHAFGLEPYGATPDGEPPPTNGSRPPPAPPARRLEALAGRAGSRWRQEGPRVAASRIAAGAARRLRARAGQSR